MAINERFPGKSRPAVKNAPASIQSKTADLNADVAAEPVTFAPMTIKEVAAEPVEVKATAVSSITSDALAAVKSSEKPDAAFNVCDLPLKTLDLISENAAAVLDFAAALGKAKSVSDAIELQSRFASQRYSTLLRQTNEMAELTRHIAIEISAPARLSLSAFIR